MTRRRVPVASYGPVRLVRLRFGGNGDSDYWYADCSAGHAWTGAMHPNRTIEGRRLAERDAKAHARYHHAWQDER